MRAVCRRIITAELPLLLLVSPALLFPRGPLPLAGLVAILVLWLARLVGYRRVTLATPLDFPMLILLAMSLQALYPSTDLTLSMPKLYGIVLGVAVYYAVVNQVTNPRRWWIGVYALLPAALGVAAVGLVSTDWITDKLPHGAALYAHIPRLVQSVQSSSGPIAGIQPNELGGTLAFLLPVAVGVVLWSVGRRRGDGETGRGGELRTQNSEPSALTPTLSQRERESTQRLAHSTRLPILAGMTLLVAGPVLILTQSRSSLLGFAVAVALLVGLRWRRLGFMILAAVAVGGAVGAVAGREVITRWVLQIDYVGDVSSKFAGREEIWSRAIYMIQDFPFTGVGLNTFPKVLMSLYPSASIGSAADVPHAHNIYLQAAVDLGLAGLMAFVGICLMTLWLAVRTYRRADGPARGAIAGLGAGFLAYMVYGLTDAITLGAKPLVLLWVMVGLIVAGNRLLNDGETGRTQNLQPSPRPSPKGRGSTQHAALSTQHSEPRTQNGRPAPGTRLRFVVVEAGKTLWVLYWTVTVLFAVMAYAVVGMAITGWMP